jgi:hypothetical protein
MPKHIQIKVQESCHENWNGMQPNQQGRHCQSCQKTVVDFTDMTHTELINFFTKNNTGNTCGRFNNDQLQRSMAIPQKKVHWMKYFFRITLPAFFLSTKATAQDTTKPAMEVVDTTRPVQQIDTVVQDSLHDDSLVLDTGQLKAPNFKSLMTVGNSFVEIKCDWAILEQTLGYTVIEQKDSSFLLSPISSIFADMVNRVTNKKEPIPLPVPLPYLPLQNFITLFPSPARPSGVLHVSLENIALGKYNFFISNNNGTLFQEGIFWVDGNSAEATILLKQLPADDYLLTLVHETSKEKITQQFIVA